MDEQVKVKLLEILGDYSAIPYEVEQALARRLSGISLNESNKAPETELIDDNLGVHTAAGVMVGFVSTTGPSGTTIYIPYYT